MAKNIPSLFDINKPKPKKTAVSSDEQQALSVEERIKIKQREASAAFQKDPRAAVKKTAKAIASPVKTKTPIAPVPDDEQRRIAVERFLQRKYAMAGREGTRLASSGTLG